MKVPYLVSVLICDRSITSEFVIVVSLISGKALAMRGMAGLRTVLALVFSSVSCKQVLEPWSSLIRSYCLVSIINHALIFDLAGYTAKL